MCRGHLYHSAEHSRESRRHLTAHNPDLAITLVIVKVVEGSVSNALAVAIDVAAIKRCVPYTMAVAVNVAAIEH